MRHLATIRKIKELRPIQNADCIEVAIIDGWEVIVNKADGFKEGDLVVYIEIDSVLPDRPEFEFMRKYKFRVKTIKLRGQVSQGLILPITISCIPNGEYEVGQDLTDIIGIKKYDPQKEQEDRWWQKIGKQEPILVPWWLKPFMRIKRIRKWWIKKHQTITDFPDFIKKTDEERIQNMPLLFDQIKTHKTFLTATEKLDGTSATYFLKEDEFGVCSRNKHILKDDGSPYWQMAHKYEIEEFLRNLRNSFCKKYRPKLIVLQGEIIGPEIQGNKYHLSDRCLFAFNFIIDGVRQPYQQMIEWLDTSSISVVPYVDTIFVWKDETISDFVEHRARGTSKLRDGIEPREGIVCRNDKQNISFKVINPDFLLKEED